MNLSRIRDLLAQAVDCLDGSSSSGGGESNQSRPRTTLPGPSYQTSRPGPSHSSSFLSERNGLFNFGGRGMGKRKASDLGLSKRSKKKNKLVTWNHDFVCLAKTDMKCVPTATERSKLLSAGKHFMVICV